MEVAILPHAENNRITTLYTTNVLAASPEHFNYILRIAQRSFDVSIAAITFVGVDSIWYKFDCGLYQNTTAKLGSFYEQTVLKNEVLVVEDTLQDTRFDDNPLVCRDPLIRFYAGVPFSIDEGRCAGALCLLDTQARNFSEEDIQQLKDMAEIVIRELRALGISMVDELTGICNRHGFNTIAPLWLDNMADSPHSAVLLFIDLDRFKKINDVYGHSSGDTALVHFTKVLQSFIRNTDLSSRYGGDEFVVLMPNTSAKEVQTVVKQMKRAIYSTKQQQSWLSELAFSFGYVEFIPNQRKGLTSLLDGADKRMYENKNVTARNTITSAKPLR